VYCTVLCGTSNRYNNEPERWSGLLHLIWKEASLRPSRQLLVPMQSRAGQVRKREREREKRLLQRYKRQRYGKMR
jgi:hypothetical protein